MTQQNPISFFAIRLALLSVLCFLAPSESKAQVYGPYITSGNYTLEYTRKGTTTYLEEKAGAFGSWSTVTSVNGGSGTASHSFANKPSGEFFYRTNVKTVGYRGIVTWWTSAEKKVVVTGAPPPNRDTVTNQMQYGYSIRQGDLNYDGLPDLFIQRTSGGTANNGSIGNVILQRYASGQYGSVLPTPAQSAIASTWPVSNAEVERTDLNLDGFVDILLPDLGNHVGGTGQIVVAPGSASALPQRVIPMDAKYNKFITDTANWIEDPDYIINNSSLVAIPYYEEIQICDWVHHGDWEEYVCEWIWVWAGDYYAYDVSWVDIDSYYLRYSFNQYVNGILQPVVSPGSTDGRNIDFSFFNVFGIQVMRGVFTSNCGGDYDYDTDLRPVCIDWGYLLLDELAQKKKPSNWRYLTTGEKATAQEEGLSIYGIDLVRVYNKKYSIFRIDDIVAPNGHIYIGNGNSSGMPWRQDYWLEPGTGVSPGWTYRWLGILVHELMHVYQARNLGCITVCMYARGAVSQLGSGYTYMPMDPKAFYAHNLEQQAEMVSDRFLRRRCEPTYRDENRNATVLLLNQKIPFPTWSPNWCD